MAFKDYFRGFWEQLVRAVRGLQCDVEARGDHLTRNRSLQVETFPNGSGGREQLVETEFEHRRSCRHMDEEDLPCEDGDHTG